MISHEQAIDEIQEAAQQLADENGRDFLRFADDVVGILARCGRSVHFAELDSDPEPEPDVEWCEVVF